MNTVSILIPTYKRPVNLINCLNSIENQSSKPEEVLIINGDDSEELEEYLRQNFKTPLNYKIIKSPKGLTRQRNAGIKCAKGDIVIFIDDDVILNKDYIKEIFSVFQNFTEGMGGVSGSVEAKGIYANSIFRMLSQIYSRIFLLHREGNGRFLSSGFSTYLSGNHCKEVAPVEFLFGCNMAFKKEIFKEFQFDENLFRCMYMEDDDFAYRISRKYQNYFTPFAKVVHMGPIEKRDDFVRAHALMKNYFYLHKKNFPKTLGYDFAFFWALSGWVFVEFMQSMFLGNGNRIKGLFAGLKDAVYSK